MNVTLIPKTRVSQPVSKPIDTQKKSQTIATSGDSGAAQDRLELQDSTQDRQDTGKSISRKKVSI